MRRSKENIEYWNTRTNKLILLDPKFKQVKYIYDALKLLLQEKYPQFRNSEARDNWGEGLEELINQIRQDGSTDSVHIHDFVRGLLLDRYNTIQMLKDIIYLDRKLRLYREGEEDELKELSEQEYIVENLQ